MQINPLSFKGYVPVKFYARNPKDGKYSRVIKHENLRKCQGFVVRNLNGTAKSNRNEEFVNFYRKQDKDYRYCPAVMSMYDEDRGRDPIVYMITGSDVDIAKQMAKPVGIAKGESLDRLGTTKSFEAKYEAQNYTQNIKRFLARNCKRLKNTKGQNLTLRVFFNPKYNKKNELKGFDFVHSEFIVEQ